MMDRQENLREEEKNEISSGIELDSVGFDVQEPVNAAVDAVTYAEGDGSDHRDGLEDLLSTEDIAAVNGILENRRSIAGVIENPNTPREVRNTAVMYATADAVAAIPDGGMTHEEAQQFADARRSVEEDQERSSSGGAPLSLSETLRSVGRRVATVLALTFGAGFAATHSERVEAGGFFEDLGKATQAQIKKEKVRVTNTIARNTAKRTGDLVKGVIESPTSVYEERVKVEQQLERLEDQKADAIEAARAKYPSKSELRSQGEAMSDEELIARLQNIDAAKISEADKKAMKAVALQEYKKSRGSSVRSKAPVTEEQAIAQIEAKYNSKIGKIVRSSEQRMEKKPGVQIGRGIMDALGF
jgi:hypothetical protein